MSRRKAGRRGGKSSKDTRKRRKQQKTGVWLGGRGSLGGTVEEEGVVRESDWVLWYDPAEGVVGGDIVKAADRDDCVGRLLRTAIESPLEGAPRKPRHVRVATQALADEVRATLGAGVMIEIAPTPELDEIAKVVTESLVYEAVDRSYLEAEDVNAELVRSFFSSACKIASRAPWNALDEGCGLMLDIPELGVADAVVAVTGHVMEPPGFFLFPSEERYLEFIAAESEELAQDSLAGQGHGAGLIVGLLPHSELSVAMQSEIDEHGWSVPSDGLCPVVLGLEPGSGERPPDARTYHLATVISHALSELSLESDLHEEEDDDDFIDPQSTVFDGVVANGVHVRLEVPGYELDEDPWLELAPVTAEDRQPLHLPDKLYEALLALEFLSPRARRTLSTATPAPQGGEWLLDAPVDDLEHVSEILVAAARKRIGGEMVGYAAQLLGVAAMAVPEIRIDLERAAPKTSKGGAGKRVGEQGGTRQKSKGGGSRSRAGPAVLYQIQVTLKRIRPPIWRRIELRSDLTLPRLHDVIQSAMGWSDSHLHAFECGGERFGIPDPDFDFDFEEIVDERRIRLDALLQKPKQQLEYFYDFGDGWEHQIVLEKILPLPAGKKAPRWRCTDGRRACPPEDCGGPGGYANLLKALTDRRHPDHEQMRKWVGGSYDPEHFPLREA